MQAQTGGSPAADVADAYQQCWRIARSHYENFTVGSWLLPRRLRRHIAAIYAFARTADDLADEGTVDSSDRLARLEAWERSLQSAFRGEARDPIFVALAHTVREFNLPIEPFQKLLQAFRMDAAFVGFEDFQSLRAYCRCSADPVGHLILYLFGYRDAALEVLADQVCTGLQLANFWQDIGADAAKGRLYVPRDELRAFNCTAVEVTEGMCTTPVKRLLRFQVERARTLLTDGAALADHVDARLGREVRLFTGGGLAVLRGIEAVDYDVVRRRPTVSRRAKARLVWQALLTPTRAPAAGGSVPARTMDNEGVR